MDPAVPARVHGLLMELVRAIGLHHPDQVLPGHPVSVSQAFALHELDAATPLSQRDLAARLGLEKSSVSRMAAEMERKGLLVRERAPGNRRLYRLRLTDRGRAVHCTMAAAFHEQYVRAVAAMAPAEREALLVGLAAFVRVLGGEAGASATAPQPGRSTARLADGPSPPSSGAA